MHYKEQYMPPGLKNKALVSGFVAIISLCTSFTRLVHLLNNANYFFKRLIQLKNSKKKLIREAHTACSAV